MKRMITALLIGTSLLVVMTVSAGAQEGNTDAWIPGLASFLIPGLGQLLNDEIDKAILHFGVDVAIIIGGGYLTWLMPYPGYGYGYSIVGLAHLAWSLYSGYDAYTVAKKSGFSLGMTEEGLTLAYRF